MSAYVLGDIIPAPSGELHIFIAYSLAGEVVTVTRSGRAAPQVYIDAVAVAAPVTARPEPAPEAPTVDHTVGRWSEAEIDQLLELDGTPLAEVATIIGRSVAAIKHRRKLLRQAGRLPGWSGARCYCGKPAVAQQRCHNHYQVMRMRRAAA